MISVFLRSLTLACSLILTLPAGWCCMVQVGAPPQEATCDSSEPSSCCGNCKAPAKPRTPAPLPPGKCPCSDRQTTMPDSLKVIGCDLSLPAPITAIDLVSARVVGAGNVASPFFPFDLSLHLLHRVWLC